MRALAVARAAALGAVFAAGGAAAQTQAPSPAPSPSPTPPAIASDPAAAEIERKRALRTERDAQLKEIEARLAENTRLRRAIDAEIAAIRADRAKLNAALIDATRASQATEGRIAALEARIGQLGAQEAAIRGSLQARRGLIGDVLAALQRMGRRPPPAVLVRPEDVLEAVRASILLGAVLPELRGEVQALAADLAELVRVREQIVQERAGVQSELVTLAQERVRLDGLVAARREREQQRTAALTDEARAGETLAAEARTLRDLIERLERELGTAERQAEEARRALEAQSREARERMAALAARDPARLQPQIAFPELRGRLPLPVSGSQLRAFGAADGFGGQARGASFTAAPGAVVAAPADGWVAFAGPFRSFGQLVILRMGGGYYILLAGLRRADVTRGQFVLAGEPVGVLGDGPEGAPIALGDGAGQPILYVELRRDGQSIDPGPWWATTHSDRVRG
jgi:septal ring factor EnvC (AmiA/AmiB activator)